MSEVQQLQNLWAWHKRSPLSGQVGEMLWVGGRGAVSGLRTRSVRYDWDHGGGPGTQLPKAHSSLLAFTSPCRGSCAHPGWWADTGRRRPSVLSQVGLRLRLRPLVRVLLRLLKELCRLCLCQLGFCFLAELTHLLHLRFHQLDVAPGGDGGLICSCRQTGRVQVDKRKAGALWSSPEHLLEPLSPPSPLAFTLQSRRLYLHIQVCILLSSKSQHFSPAVSSCDNF